MAAIKALRFAQRSLARVASSPVTPPLDPSFYNLDEEESSFLKIQTGIKDDKELKRHILEVQAEAYAIHPYPCIRGFDFTSLRFSKHSAYKTVLALGKERHGVILLDVGCCFGNDIRKIIADGFPRENIVASDIYSDFWALGHKLFKTSQESFPVTFIPGDVFDPTFLSPERPPVSTPVPSLTSLSSLTALKQHVSIIHASYLFHLFSESQQYTLAHRLGSLLSPTPGSVILGSHMVAPDTEESKAGVTHTTPRGFTWFAHSPTSWKNLWIGKGDIFKPDDVVMKIEAREFKEGYICQTIGSPTNLWHLSWSITRKDLQNACHGYY